MDVLVKNNNTRLFTTIYPNQGKETVILLHGGPGVPDGLGPVAEFLSKHFQVITFHQRGTLNSPCYTNSYSIDDYLTDIDSIAEHFDLQQFHLFGHSWGGLYAQIYAAETQPRILSMFLCSPASGTGKQWLEMVLEVSRYNRKKSTLLEWISMVKNTSIGMLGSDEAFQKFYTQFCLNCNKEYNLENPVPVLVSHITATPVVRTNIALLFYPELPKLSALNFKVTVTYAEDDIFEDSTRHVRARYPEARFVTIPKSNHFTWLSNEKSFYEVLREHYGL